MRVTGPGRLFCLLSFILAAAMLATACATPAIRAIDAPATPTPVPTPTVPPVPTVADQPTPTPAPSDGEKGLAPDSIRIGVIIDVGDGRVSDQMSESAAQAVEAWANNINNEGGLAGRDVTVERFLTSPLLADHAEIIDLACNRDIFALVGSAALFDNDGLDQLQSPECRLPDFPAQVTSKERLESTVTTVSNPIVSDPWLAGWARYYAENNPEGAVAAATMLLDVPVSVINGSRMIEAVGIHGFEFVYRPEVAFDTDFVAEVGQIAEVAPQVLTWPNDGGRLITLLSELDAQEVDIPTIDCGQACYSRFWVEDAGAQGNGVSAWLATRPLEEADLNGELTRYLFLLGRSDPTAIPTSTGVNAWASALLFEEAVKRAVGVDTPAYDPTSLTRASVLAAASTIASWDAGGLHGLANPAAGLASPCFVLLTLGDGVWNRTFPERRGEFDCAPENLVPLKVTGDFGADPTPTPAPAPDDENVEDGG
jgi:ABC-type branched-subunit amino acid transport system substrate-binding protein